ncbi:Uncharacterized protein BM_BM18047 [Brugia malayi]|uniref:Uncharacterized protein n=1 Tax=Brugia malayi TaxID=6279 RepID=A0A4E9F4X3_BRUMA|nr:Uncharacterized protein BM_BM18047 [Brugia malayi]VIO89291.1 Uncharacterized protein BM_BM18047 [Brugia malayi]
MYGVKFPSLYSSNAPSHSFLHTVIQLIHRQIEQQKGRTVSDHLRGMDNPIVVTSENWAF